MDQAQALAAFDNGIGDGVALWAPPYVRRPEKGWKIAGDLHMCKVGNPIVPDRRHRVCRKKEP